MTLKTLNIEHNDVLVNEIGEISDITIGELSKRFAKKKTDAIVITKERKPYYVITSTDIIDALVEHNDSVQISEYIKKFPKELVLVDENETLFEAYRLMRNKKIHHLIVTDENGFFKCVINYYDFASYLTEIALKDEMTGLYNKRFFEFIIDKYKNDNIEMGIIFLDINDFKLINDTYGHIFGDEVLKETANIIKQSIRDIDYAFRFGGDEFVILIFTDLHILKKISLRLEEKINNLIINSIKISAAVGYAHYPSDSKDIYKVIDIADKRMYEYKKRVKNSIS